MPEPAYHVRCSGKQDFHFKLVEEKGVLVVCAHLQCIWEQVRHVAGLYFSKENVYDAACMSLAEFCAFLFYLVFAIDLMFSIDS